MSKASESPSDQRTGRRKLAVALVGLAVGSLATRVAAALPRARHLLEQANQLLHPFGLSVSSASVPRESLTVRAVERPDTELDFIVTERPRGIDPCIKTTFLNHVAEFTHFERVNGQAEPCVRTLVDGPLVAFEHFDLVESRSTPTVKTTIEDTVTTFEHFDPQKSAINPCWRAVVTEGAPGASGDNTTVTVIDLALDFAVVVGARTFRLRDGALVETRA